VKIARPALALSLLVASSFSSTVQAYCRTATNDPVAVCPPPGTTFECSDKGVPLAWRKSHISYGFNKRGFPGLTDEQLRMTFKKAFDTWKNVKCESKSVGLSFSQIAGTTTLEEGPQDAEPNENVITHYDPEGWAELDYSPQAFAVTAVWYSDAGAIGGADMGINGGWDLYGDCLVSDCIRGPVLTDLQNVATHEAGHVLGLAHSPVDGSTMSCSARPNDTYMRDLSADDIKGLCAAYPPGASFPLDHADHGGCSIATSPSASTLASLAFFGVLGALGVRRRRSA